MEYSHLELHCSLAIAGFSLSWRLTLSPVRAEIQKWLNLHDTVHCILTMGAPHNSHTWNQYSTMLQDAFVRHSVLVLAGGDDYCALWVIRSFIDSFMHAQGCFMHVDSTVAICDLPGSDESGHLPTVSEIFANKLALQIMTELDFQLSPQLFAMILYITDLDLM